jgi:cell shape-determining protein MreC
MCWTEIKTNEKMNQSLKDSLEMIGDTISLYALKRIDELEKENEKLSNDLDFAVSNTDNK